MLLRPFFLCILFVLLSSASTAQKNSIKKNLDGSCTKYTIKKVEQIDSLQLKQHGIFIDSLGVKKIYVSSSSYGKKKEYKNVYDHYPVVCEDDRSELFYKIVLAVLSERGFEPYSNTRYLPNFKSYESEQKEKAINAMYIYNNEVNAPLCKFSMEAMDSLGIRIDKLDSLRKVYKIEEPTREKRMQYKINFDLNRLDENGLQGPEDGKRSLDYHFWIPKEKLNEVKEIDPTLIVVDMPLEKRNFICQDCLIVKGSTHKKNHKEKLLLLAELPYVETIRESIYVE